MSLLSSTANVGSQMKKHRPGSSLWFSFQSHLLVGVQWPNFAEFEMKIENVRSQAIAQGARVVLICVPSVALRFLQDVPLESDKTAYKRFSCVGST